MSKVSKKSKEPKFYAYLSIWSSIIGNTILFVLKLIAGMMSSSVAVIADAWHTLSDSISSVIVLIGIRISQKRPDKEHPFGYGRADTIASGILSVLLAVIAFEFLIQGIQKLLNHEIAQYSPFVLYVFTFSVLFKEFLAQVSLWGARKSEQKSLKADAWHHRSDAIASLVIIIAVLLNKKFWWIDGAMGILVSLIIFLTAYEIMRDVAKTIIGTRPDSELQAKIKEISNKVAGRKIFAHNILLHTYGNHREATMHIYLPPETPLNTAHGITDKIEKELKNQLNLHTTIHIEPLPDFLPEN